MGVVITKMPEYHTIRSQYLPICSHFGILIYVAVILVSSKSIVGFLVSYLGNCEFVCDVGLVELWVLVRWVIDNPNNPNKLVIIITSYYI